MARKEKCKCPDPPPSAPLWMATFSDMVTLLLTFFVMLLAMANFDDVGRVRAVLESIQVALAVGGYNEQLLGITENEHNLEEDIEKPENFMPQMSRLASALAEHTSDDRIKMSKSRTEVRLMVDPSMFFEPGGTEIHPSAFGFCADIAETMTAFPDLTLDIEGHTDATGNQRNNWRLSALRAAEVGYAIESRGSAIGQRVAATGRAQHQPHDTTDPTSPWNRRVELVFVANKPAALEGLMNLDNLGGPHGR